MSVRHRLARVEVGRLAAILSGLLVVTWRELGNKIR